jgi:hypothetical protein
MDVGRQRNAGLQQLITDKLKQVAQVGFNGTDDVFRQVDGFNEQPKTHQPPKRKPNVAKQQASKHSSSVTLKIEQPTIEFIEAKESVFPDEIETGIDII